MMKDELAVISQETLDILRCPFDRQSRLSLEETALVCQRCEARFPIREGLPSLLQDEAELPKGCTSRVQLPCQQSGETV